MAENTDSNSNWPFPDADDAKRAHEGANRETDPVEQELVEENLAQKKKESDAVNPTIPDESS